MRFSNVLAAALAVSLSLGVLGSTSIAAQRQGQPQRRAPRGSFEIMGLTKELGLTQAQQSQIGPILQNLHKQVGAIRQNPDNMDSKRTQIDSAFNAASSSIKTILTAAQQKKLQASGGLRGMLRKIGPEMPPMGPPGARGPMRMYSQLNLSEAQKKKLEAIFKAIQPQMEKIRSLSREERRPKMQALMKSMQPKIDAILTPAQRKKLQELQEARARESRGGEKPNGF